jgi:cysteinyl-tRNA synthetase
MPYLRALSSFRDAVRNMALNKASHADLLALCDRLRDEDMLELGVVLDDREGGAALIKFGDPAQLIQERDEKRRREEEKRAKKAAAAAEKERKRLERLELGKLSPEEMFKVGEYANQFTQYDENVS